MPWKLPSLRDRRAQARDVIAANLPGADATQPNSVLRVLGDALALMTHDNDQHLSWVARMMMPDTAEGEFLERWANIWLPQGRKGASGSTGSIVVTGSVGAMVPANAVLTATVADIAGQRRAIEFRVINGVTLSTTSAVVAVSAVMTGAVTNLDEGAQLAFVLPPANIDGQATIAAPGLGGGADIETDADLLERLLNRIRQPPHGGNANDYAQWALAVPGVTRAWARQEVAIGTVTVRVMLDEARSANNGIPDDADLALVKAAIDEVRPITVSEFWVVAPIPQPLDLTISGLASDTPAVRLAIDAELAAMLAARASPGSIIYASWIREAISAASGEDHHEIDIDNVVPLTAGHIVVPGTVTYE